QPQPRKSAAAACSLQAEIATRFSSPRIAPPSFILSAQGGWRVSILPQFGHGTESSLRKFRTSSPCAAIPLISYRELRALAQPARQGYCSNMALSKQRLPLVVFPNRLKTCGFSDRLRR